MVGLKMKFVYLKMFVKDTKVLWKKYRLISTLRHTKSAEIGYALGYFLSIKTSKATCHIRVEGKIKEYFDGFDSSFFRKKVKFSEHNLQFIADILFRNMNDFEVE